MEKNLAQGITEYWLQLPLQYKEKLAHIRVWSSLRVAVDGDDIWVRGISPAQLYSPEIRSVPFKKIYFQQADALFLLGGNLPEKRLKTSWMWSPIHTFLPMEMPAYNFNYFGVQDTVGLQLKPSNEERAAVALWVEMKDLEKYITKMPAVRMQGIQWTIIDEKALLIGTPLLSLPGETMWRHQNFLVPSGYDFEYPELSMHFQKIITEKTDERIILNTDHTYLIVKTSQIQPLSISSFRLSHEL